MPARQTLNAKQCSSFVIRRSFVLLTLLCTSCISGRGLESERRWPKIDWDVQTLVLESRQAFDEATGRKYEYEGFDMQPAR